MHSLIVSDSGAFTEVCMYKVAYRRLEEGGRIKNGCREARGEESGREDEKRIGRDNEDKRAEIR